MRYNKIVSYAVGDTIQLKCIFKNFNGVNVDPQLVKLKIYDYNYVLLQEIILTNENRVETGVYVYDYITPNDRERRIVYEFHGEIDGTPSIKRASFRTKFV